ncbi:MAG: T9SS type A sorting domain-containing protein [Bacteroidetes bacterium]|nr:T9SS type A sorting domain-containing protein [Bacteroidota bacterium]
MVTKTTGTVNLLNSIEVAQDLTTVNATSILNTNGVDVTIGRDFINSHGATTFTGIGASSTLIFNGTAAQVYNPNNNAATPTLTLNNVTMLNTGGAAGVTISTINTPNMILGTSGVLTLTSGRIITPNTQEVVAMNTANNAVSVGNTTSFVQGNLRRYLAAGATGSFDFPVGHSTPGYERANINFTSAAAVAAIQLLARFDPWGGAWLSPAAPNWTECSTTYNMPYLNNGYWSIDASSVSTGLYDLTLYNLGYSNAAIGFSIAKSSSAAPTWALNGNCVASPVTAVRRNSMSGFSKMATIQASSLLSVELLEFNGVSRGTHNELFWLSTKELNFKNYELESSEDGISFNAIAKVEPIGQTSTFNKYTYLDFDYYNPVTYYRLKMNDLNGDYRYSQIIDIGNKIQNETSIKIYPNPAYNELYVYIESETETNATIEIKDMLGRLIYTQDVDLTARIKNTFINTTSFAQGTYVVSINYKHSPSENIKIVINNRN